MIEEDWDPMVAYPLLNTSKLASASSVKTVDPLSYLTDSNTKPYKAKIVLSGTATIPALADAGYSTSQSYIIYETMAYHVENKLETATIESGESYIDVALELDLLSASLKKWLEVASVPLSALGIIQERCKLIQEHGYTYSGFKECGIYDPTRFNKYIEVYQAWGQGHITLSWGYDSSTGYRNPSWGHDVLSPGLTTSNPTVRDTGVNAYNQNIASYGYWKWEAGEFGA